MIFLRWSLKNIQTPNKETEFIILKNRRIKYIKNILKKTIRAKIAVTEGQDSAFLVLTETKQYTFLIIYPPLQSSP